MTVSLDSTCEQSPLGLSSVTALSQLHSQLATVLQEHQHSPKRNGHWQAAWSKCFLHHSVCWSSLHWPGALLTTLCAASLITCHIFDQNSDGTSLISGCALLLLLLADIVAMAALQQLKMSEMPHRVETLLNTLQDFLLHPPSDWLKETEDLFVPSLPAVSLQWTYRDGRLINLPVSLLVEGDIISLRPGSEAPTELRGIQEEEHVILSQSDVFSHLSSPPSPLDQERSRPHRLLQPKLFRVTQTPAVEVVQRCLELSQHRPVSVLDNERFTVQTLLERGPAPLALMALLVLNTLRYILGAPGVGPWHVTLLQLPVNGILPLLPLTFPLLWFLVGIYGEVRVLLHMDPQPTALWEVWKQTCRKYVSVLFGRSSALCHTASLLHNLGSVTVLCCVDKQGILSWPSPNPEKILFFSTSLSSERTKQKDKDREKIKDDRIAPRPHCGLEMLSLSLDRTHFDDTRVQFDDMQWERHAPSLRPLGLAIQLLLGNATVATRVLRLSDHLTQAALLRTRPPCQPVRPPWGLCQLPKLLGKNQF
ncbi:transmembrane protein 94-like [Tachysurus ichikawai]